MTDYLIFKDVVMLGAFALAAIPFIWLYLAARIRRWVDERRNRP
ncbi:hypothetical protein [Stappia indica]|nr:hypothetical protein [Stappia indica]